MQVLLELEESDSWHWLRVGCFRPLLGFCFGGFCASSFWKPKWGLTRFEPRLQSVVLESEVLLGPQGKVKLQESEDVQVEVVVGQGLVLEVVSQV